jgi:hypothetical protein
MKDQTPVAIDRELLAQMMAFIQAYGAVDSPNAPDYGNCVSCGVLTFTDNPHHDFCEWAKIVDHPGFRALSKDLSHD